MGSGGGITVLLPFNTYPDVPLQISVQHESTRCAVQVREVGRLGESDEGRYTGLMAVEDSSREDLREGAQGVLHSRFDGLRQPAETLLRRHFEQSETLNILQPPDVRSARVGRSFLRMAKRHAHS